MLAKGGQTLPPPATAPFPVRTPKMISEFTAFWHGNI